MWKQIPLYPAYEMYLRTRRVRLIEDEIMQEVVRVGFDEEPGHLVFTINSHGDKRWHIVTVAELFAMTFPEEMGPAEHPQVAITDDWVSLEDYTLSDYEINSVGQVRYIKYRNDDILPMNRRNEYYLLTDTGNWLCITRRVLLFQTFGKQREE